MSDRVRLTASQAIVRYLSAQRTVVDGQEVPLCAGVFAIFGHGNVAGMGEALSASRAELPTYRAHNEQAMAHAAIAYAKTMRRRRFMACTTSIGPGATNMLTAAALAHVNRLPVLLLPGDVFASRRPDPVLQQVEDFGDPTVTANDCFRPVSRYWDRISRPEQLMRSLPQALGVLTDPAECGPVTLALPQDVQAEAWEYPISFFQPRVHELTRLGPDTRQLTAAAEAIRRAKQPLIIAGGGVHYAQACETLARFAERFSIPVAETQAGKGALRWNHPQNVGSIGVTGSSAANELARDADVIIAIGTRLQDFTTASSSLFRNPQRQLIAINVCRFDAAKFGALQLQGDALRALDELNVLLEPSVSAEYSARVKHLAQTWNSSVEAATAVSDTTLPTDAQVLGAVNRAIGTNGTVVCAAGGLPGELHKLWRAQDSDAYHLEYGYSCMGYEIAGGLGVKLARPDRNVVVMVGDGSYLMMNSEIATAIALGLKLTIVLLDNRGYGCISRLQKSCGGTAFNNLLEEAAPAVDFVAHARSLGAESLQVNNVRELERALNDTRAQTRTVVIVINTDPHHSTAAGGAWWDVAVPEVSGSKDVAAANEKYRKTLRDVSDLE
ncbi:3D-(3,5/4)-trihydroxycyclohexane-1,2-dione acylhydrolase (decyclizing) [Steroidobacter agaridevorans]|uniref:3D-(3,5/4)-trihydroxycyclohexane-1,2-dione acylhydrolase (Decyclizing) n=1 Tax=Steroidobacter agaridevorans TaxID=2695856 RepID=A0A829YJ19_9GAMM|nr:3D-(3,5/4)-trihydroxycyclohexane-1,2-dione acylhydrolase (decyclizing) [Steroidobacter agaridevorans]GFE82853.1 3D-(3,5/4)-trihydroxycyclohexane-1,2-dione acylhydrolase (decyclizing) [Steroidobacter agaridevorans]